MSVTKKLANISLDDNYSINTVLSTIPTSSLRSLYLADNRGAEVSLKKTELKKLITPAITSASTKYLVERMTSEQLAAAIAPLKINHEKKRNNPNSRKVLSKRLTENLMSTGKFFTSLRSEIFNYRFTLQVSSSSSRSTPRPPS